MTQQDTADRPETATRYAAGPPMGTNRFASWARVCGLLALAPLAAVFAVVALVQVRRSGQRGKGAAIVGLVGAVFWTLVLIGLTDVADPGVSRDSAGGVSHAQVDSVHDLKTGDCFKVLDRTPTGAISRVLLVPCADHHEGRVYATPLLPKDSLSPETGAAEACRQATPAGINPLGLIYPTDTREMEDGHAKATCYSQD
ncbi:hypothetical protein ABT095_11620 [Kitasatospora sp. NPDC002227]|uniref:hypothetical protein n=1 Tax=Kitasatospora sp. NPDC002227 TaxID=3154773 RepID=UPI00331AC885